MAKKKEEFKKGDKVAVTFGKIEKPGTVTAVYEGECDVELEDTNSRGEPLWFAKVPVDRLAPLGETATAEGSEG